MDEFEKPGMPYLVPGGLDQKYLRTPCLDPLTGRPWWQACYCCGKSVDLRPGRCLYVNIGGMVRHKKCLPLTI